MSAWAFTRRRFLGGWNHTLYTAIAALSPFERRAGRPLNLALKLPHRFDILPPDSSSLEASKLNWIYANKQLGLQSRQ
jgi:hypothetical protein